MKAVVISAVLFVVAIVSLMVMPGEATINCGQVSSSLAPCGPFLTGDDASPSTRCCAGVKSLTTLAPTTADRRAACECVKAAAARYPNIEDAAASSLPQKCGIDFHIPISKSTDCQTIN